jgi:hypothetical protein
MPQRSRSSSAAPAHRSLRRRKAGVRRVAGHFASCRGPLGRRHIEDVYRDLPVVRDRRIDFYGDIRSRVID